MRVSGVCCLAVLSCQLFGFAERTAELRCKDGQNLPVSGVEVTVRNAARGVEVRCVTQSGTGSCRVTLPSDGEYVVRAKAEGLEGEAILQAGASAAAITLQPTMLSSSVTVVSGSRTEELQEESATKVDVVSRQQIVNTGYERVSDLLQEMPGVLVRRGNTSTVGGEQIQGIDSRQVLVLQDGLPVLGARGIKSGVVNLNRQSSGRLNRIEVAKGTSSSLYGSDAIGGVINMITQEPSTPLEGGLVLSGGSLGMFDGRADVGGRRGRGYAYANLGTSRMDSYSLLPNSPTTVGPQVRRDDILFKTRFQAAPTFGIGFTANAYRNREEGRNASETGLVNGRALDSNQSYAVVADWVPGAATTVQMRGYTARYDEDSYTTPLTGGVTAAANLNERMNRLDTTVSHQFGSQHLLQGGAEWVQIQYRGLNRLAGDNVGQQITARDFWLQDKWTYRRLTATIGGRITDHSRFGNAAVPKFGLIYRLSDSVIVRGSFGMGFRAPDLGQLYFRFANPASFYQVIGNTRLTPEHSQSWQTGLTFRKTRYRLGMTLFRNNVRDLIDTRLIGTPRTAAELNSLLAEYRIEPIFNPLLGRQTFVYFNQARIFTQGVELDGEYAFTRRLRVSGAYTFLNAKDSITNAALLQRHRHTGVVRADYSIPKWGLTANVRGSFYSHWQLTNVTRGLPFQIWDAYGAKSWAKGFETFVAVDNFANSRDGKLQYATPSFDRPDYGRTARVGVRYRFGRSEF
ncbi:TonB-dependent receptor [Bryobacterales bacterium F-183]|nr:TonB-dependent receptor [Bryobacterales bacterium F-183]